MAESETYILFKLAGATYAIAGKFVQQMEMMEHITPVPNTQSYIEGVMFSRGQVIPAINLRLRLGFEKEEYNIGTRVIVINHNDRIVGLIVDSSREFIIIPSELIHPAPEFITGLSDHYLDGIAKLNERIILIFNVAEILKSEDSKLITNKI